MEDFIQQIEKSIYEELTQGFKKYLLDPETGLENTKHLLTFVEEHFKLIKALVSVNGDKAFEQSLIQIIEQFIYSIQKSDTSNHCIPFEYSLSLSVNLVTSIIYTWFKEDEPRSADEILEIFLIARMTSPHELFS